MPTPDFHQEQNERLRNKSTLLGRSVIWEKLISLRASRLAQGSAANLFAICSQLLIQLISVPVLAHTLGLETYGIWLILSTIPTYLILSDVGLVTASTNDMAIRHAAGDEKGVVAVFQATSAVVIGLFSTVAVLSVVIVGLTLSVPGIWTAAARPHAWAAALLAGYASLCIISMLPVAALRATGHYARGTLMYDACTLVEALLTLGAAAVTRNLVIAAAAPLVFRALALPVIYWQMTRLQPHMYFAIPQSIGPEVRRLMPAALGVLAIPAGLALSLQGLSLVIGGVLGAAAVAAFVPVRTASRMAILVAGVAGRALIPEISGARGRGDAVAERRYWRINMVVTWGMLLPAGIGFALFGSQLVSIWTGGAVQPSQALVWVMAATIVIHGLWYLSAGLLTASHDHIAIAPHIVVVSALGLVVAWYLVPLLGLVGAALSLLLTDVVLAAVIGWHVHRLRRLY